MMAGIKVLMEGDDSMRRCDEVTVVVLRAVFELLDELADATRAACHGVYTDALEQEQP